MSRRYSRRINFGNAVIKARMANKVGGGSFIKGALVGTLLYVVAIILGGIIAMIIGSINSASKRESVVGELLKKPSFYSYL